MNKAGVKFGDRDAKVCGLKLKLHIENDNQFLANFDFEKKYIQKRKWFRLDMRTGLGAGCCDGSWKESWVIWGRQMTAVEVSAGL